MNFYFEQAVGVLPGTKINTAAQILEVLIEALGVVEAAA